MTKSLSLTAEEQQQIREMLVACPVSRDALPYTQGFTDLKTQFETSAKRKMTGAQFWQAITRVAKKGLGGPRKPKVESPQLSDEQQLEILRLMPEGTGSRDRLPYSPDFDELYRQFTARTGTKLSKNEVWLAIVSLAKKSRKPKPLFDAATTDGLKRETVEWLQMTNPWWQGKPAPQVPYFRRYAFTEVRHRLDSQPSSLVALCGPKQVGKTTIQRQMVEHLLLIDRVDPSRILRVQFDEIPQLGSFREPVATVVRWYEDNVLGQSIDSASGRKPIYLLLDEVQNLPDWEEQLESLAKHSSARVFVTGSSSMRDGSGQSMLTDRWSLVEVGPLHLREIAGFRNLGLWPLLRDASDTANWLSADFWLDAIKHFRKRAKLLGAAFDAFSQYGGFPICHRNVDFTKSELADHLLRTVVNASIERDASRDQPNRSVDHGLLRETFRLLCLGAGEPLTPETLGGKIHDRLQTKVAQRDVSAAINAFAESLLIRPISARGEDGSKLCLCDPFIREAWLQEPIPLTAKTLDRASPADAATAERLIQSLLGYQLAISGAQVSWMPEREEEPGIDLVLDVDGRQIPIDVRLRKEEPTDEDAAGIDHFRAQETHDAPFGLVVTRASAGKLGSSAIAVPVATFLAIVQSHATPPAGLPLFESWSG